MSCTTRKRERQKQRRHSQQTARRAVLVCVARRRSSTAQRNTTHSKHGSRCVLKREERKEKERKESTRPTRWQSISAPSLPPSHLYRCSALPLYCLTYCKGTPCAGGTAIVAAEPPPESRHSPSFFLFVSFFSWLVALDRRFCKALEEIPSAPCRLNTLPYLRSVWCLGRAELMLSLLFPTASEPLSFCSPFLVLSRTSLVPGASPPEATGAKPLTLCCCLLLLPAY